MTPLTPLILEILLHYYCRGGCPVEGLDVLPQAFDRSPGREGIEALRAIGAINYEGNNLMITDVGRAWVKSILATPVPRLAFIDQNGNEIKL